jgi:hypothetical protein
MNERKVSTYHEIQGLFSIVGTFLFEFCNSIDREIFNTIKPQKME